MYQQRIKHASYVFDAQDALNVNCDLGCRTAPGMHQEIPSISSNEQNAAEMVDTTRGRGWCGHAYSGGPRNEPYSSIYSRHYLKDFLSSLSGGGYLALLIGGRLKLASALGLVLLSASGGWRMAGRRGIISAQFFLLFLRGR